MMTSPPVLPLDNDCRARAAFRADVVRGLRSSPKELPCKYFYDDAGSALFEQITQLDEYYLTRTELDIMKRHARGHGPRCWDGAACSSSMAAAAAPRRGCCSTTCATRPAMCRSTCRRASCAVGPGAARMNIPDGQVLPLCADFTRPLSLPVPPEAHRSPRGLFPRVDHRQLHAGGSASRLLRRTAALCGPGGGLLLGIDLQKDPRVIEAAYNDRPGRHGRVQPQSPGADQSRARRRLRPAPVRPPCVL